MYHIENQEKLYFHSKIDELNLTIKRLQESHLYAEVQHYKQLSSKKTLQIERVSEELKVSLITEEELMKDRNRFREEKEKLERELHALHQKLHRKEELLLEKSDTINQTEQRLLRTENERNNLSGSLTGLEQVVKNLRHDLHNKEDALLSKIESIHELEQKLLYTENERNNQSISLSKLKENGDVLTSENNVLMKERQKLLQQVHSLNTKVDSQLQHISDLNSALAYSEETKKEMFYNLISKAEELEKLMSERKHTLDTLQLSKDRLIDGEKEKMNYIKTFISQYQKHFEENEWWLSSQFADIDQRSKQQDKRIEAVEHGQEIHFTRQNELLMNQFEEVEERFIAFLEEVDTIRDYNSKLTHNLFELKRLVENQKRSQTHIINPRPKPHPEKLVPPLDGPIEKEHE